MCGYVHLVRYIGAPIALRNGTSGPSNSSLYSQESNESFFSLSDQATIGELKNMRFIHIKKFMYVD